MAIELTVLSGALAGQVKRFDKAVVIIGRQSGCDLRFDPEKDLDVSGRHAEVHLIQGRFALHDLNSTNGTFLNGRRLESGATAEIKNGDKIKFGDAGPETEFRPVTTAVARAQPNTEVRIAMAVDKQTAGLKRMMAAGLAVVVLGSGGVLFWNGRESSRRTAELDRLKASNDSMQVVLQNSLARSGDTTLVMQVRQRVAELETQLQGASSDAERTQLREKIRATERQLRRMVQMDLPTIFARNAKATALIVSDIGGKSFSGSAFAITRDGLLVTNRHNVQDPQNGTRAARLAVKFTDTRDWLPARIVAISDADDLALIQMEREGTFPVVEAISSSATESSEGITVAIIGYPAGTETPMEGEGNDFMAKSTLGSGTVSKRTTATLQIDAFATHGSSGAPVFSDRGAVIGVVYGGHADAGGRIVYAVPSERLAGFLPEKYRAILKD